MMNKEHMVVFTKSNCPNCVSAKQLLKAKGMEFTEHSMDNAMEREDFLAKYPELKQMPQIFYKGERIGGFAGLREWIKWKERQ
jgi:glutaredoxin 3